MSSFKKLMFSKPVRRVADFLLSPLTITASVWFRYIRSRDVNGMPLSKGLFNRIGVFPINDHYYEPLFNIGKYVRKPLDQDRDLPGINMNVEEQLQLLKQLNYQKELTLFPLNSNGKLEYFYRNDSYPAGDSELLYSMIRHFKPSKIVEIGSGLSTLMAQNAIKKNREDGKICEHICIEPYEMDWLEKLPISVLRTRVEDIKIELFLSLSENDILFIDSSHMVRTQGDVLFEILELLPRLNKGVIVHVHDVFTPKDYPDYWLKDLNRFWNEQYFLEAFLSCSNRYKILLASNHLWAHYRDLFLDKCPVLKNEQGGLPASFWIKSN
jgi:hypothetical protein